MGRRREGAGAGSCAVDSPSDSAMFPENPGAPEARWSDRKELGQVENGEQKQSGMDNEQPFTWFLGPNE